MARLSWYAQLVNAWDAAPPETAERVAEAVQAYAEGRLDGRELSRRVDELLGLEIPAGV